MSSFVNAIVPKEVIELLAQLNNLLRIVPSILFILTISAVVSDWVWLGLSFYLALTQKEGILQNGNSFPKNENGGTVLVSYGLPPPPNFAAQIVKSVIVGLTGFIISFFIKEVFLWFYQKRGGNIFSLLTSSQYDIDYDFGEGQNQGLTLNHLGKTLSKWISFIKEKKINIISWSLGFILSVVTLILFEMLFPIQIVLRYFLLFLLTVIYSKLLSKYLRFEDLQNDPPNFDASAYATQFEWSEENFNQFLSQLMKEEEIIDPEDDVEIEKEDENEDRNENEKKQEDQNEDENFLVTKTISEIDLETSQDGINPIFPSSSSSSSTINNLQSSPKKTPNTNSFKSLTPQIKKKNKPTVTIAILGDVKTGKTSLLKALFFVDPLDTTSYLGKNLQVHSMLESPKKPACQAVYLQKDVILLDIPGLHGPSAEHFMKKLLQNGNLDVAIFVVTKAATKTTIQDYEIISSIAKKTFVVYNKIDELDYLKDKDSLIEQWKYNLNIDQIFLTSTKGFDPDANREVDKWLDIRGVDELRNQILSFLKGTKRQLLFAKHMVAKNQPAIGIVVSCCEKIIPDSVLPNSSIKVTATQISGILDLYFLYKGKKLNYRVAQKILLSTVGASSFSQSLFSFAFSMIPVPGMISNFLQSMLSAVSIVSKTAALLIACQQLLREGYSLEDQKLVKLYQHLEMSFIPSMKQRLGSLIANPLDLQNTVSVTTGLLRSIIEEAVSQNLLSKID